MLFRPNQTLLFLGTVLLILVALMTWRSQTFSIENAPQHSFTLIDGQNISTEELRGQPWLLYFWATSCVPCRQEQPALLDYHQQYAPQGLKMIAVAMDYDPADRVVNYARSQQLPWSVALDSKAQARRAFGNVQFTPTHLLFDAQGNLVWSHTGLMDFQHLHNATRDLLSP